MAALEIPEAVRRRAGIIRLAAFDVDGTLTDGRLWFDGNGNESKAFHVQDGLGLRLLEDHGIAVALITARDSAAVRARGKDLRLQHVFVGIKDKRACLESLCGQLGVDMTEVAYLGDDLPDLSVFDHVGFAVATANAHAWVRESAHWITTREGGQGAARELCDLILEVRGLNAAVLARFIAP